MVYIHIMADTLNYQDLPVVQRAFELVRAVDRYIQTLPRTPQGRTIGDQLFRAASSIGANIAEGRGRDKGKEYARYLRIARASANETEYWLLVAEDCSLMGVELFNHLNDLNQQCLKMLSAMISRLQTTQSEQIKEHSETYQLTDTESILL
jgi:four helix bundle protein